MVVKFRDMHQFVSADQAVKAIKSGDRIYVQAAAAAPSVLIEALTKRASELQNVEI